LEQLLEIDRYALSRAAQLQADILAHYKVYEFHPVVSKLQVYCSEDLGAFYLDVLKDRLYTTGANSLARRSAQTALWTITQAMLRWMAPFLSFTAEEAWTVLGAEGKTPLATPGIHLHGRLPEPGRARRRCWPSGAASARSAKRSTRRLRPCARRPGGLQPAGQCALTVSAEDHAMLASLGEDLKFVFITSAIELIAGDAVSAGLSPQML
jgi:isoleucyl-tRNA synthetase